MKIKGLVSVILAVIMLVSVCGISAFASEGISMADGLDALQSQFVGGKGPVTEGFAIDYSYYSPVKENDTQKYPLVIWLHGMGDGASAGSQVTKSQIAYWTSAEFQSRFEGTGGAFIFAARSPEERMMFWDDVLIFPLRAAIDSFIAENSDNIDVTKIYIGGYSMGGKMTLKMAVAYPDMFAAAFPICPAWSPSEEQLELIADIPVWLTSGKTDPLINYSSAIMPLWKSICESNNSPEMCRLSSLASVRYSDGNKTSSGHHAWFAVNYDMFSADNGDYPDMTTVNGLGEEVILTYPNGMISWLSQFSSDFDATPASDSGNIEVENAMPGGAIIEFVKNFFDKIKDFLRKIMSFFENLISFGNTQ